ncbi:hypothetical protein OJ253_570 [Cryptosporidium canis]|uniref:Uncharacterized protein n=1 Tax=Cryptosporidium canis TaxID=195482 RepID=A0A9D5DN04_9CRYT|nr:hypothetical protein OJ253_570 [Cryptosporidium canis]
MNHLDNIPDILKTKKSRGPCRFSLERLSEISICLSNLEVSVKLPILEVLVEQGELQKQPSQYKSILLNCILDCIRLALPLSTNLFGKISLKNHRNISKNEGNIKQSNTEIICDMVLCGLTEHIERLLEILNSSNEETVCSNANLSKYTYSIERATEKNSKVLIFLIEGTHESRRKEQLILIFGLLMDLLEISIDRKNIEILGVCKYAISSIIIHSGTMNIKNELIICFFLKYIKLLKPHEEANIENFLSHTCEILSVVGVSGVSYNTNTILVESFRFLRNNTKISVEIIDKEGKEGHWWRKDSIFVPDLIRKSLHEKIKDVQTPIIYIIHFLESISEEYVQSVITQMICDLREYDDKIRFQAVKMVTRFILLGIKSEYNLIFQGSEMANKIKADKDSKLKRQLVDEWLSRANDKQRDIRTEVVMGVVRAMNIFLERSEFGDSCERFVKFIIEQDDVTCPNLREDLIKAVAVWLTNQRKESNSNKLVDESIKYLLRHICDKNRNLRIFLIKYLRDYIEVPELSRNLWFLWYISFKQKDLQMRNVIEDILLEINQLEALELYSSLKKKSRLQCGTVMDENQSNSAIYKIIKTFNDQRLTLLKSLRILVCLKFMIKFNKNNLRKQVELLKLDIVKQIQHFFECEDSKENAAKNMISTIEKSLNSREDFEKWAIILGMTLNDKSSPEEVQNSLESVAEGLELDKAQEFKKIIRYLSVFGPNNRAINCNVLLTILSPNQKDENKQGLEEFSDDLDVLILKLQFKYKINVLCYLLKSEEYSGVNGEEIFELISNTISLYNQQEIFKLYECFYFNSKELFRKKLMKHLKEINSKSKKINGIFNAPFTESCFSSEDRGDDFIAEILPKGESRTIVRDIIYQIFPNVPVSRIFCSYSDFHSYLDSASLKDNYEDKDNILELFILRLYAEKALESEKRETHDFGIALGMLILRVEGALKLPDIDENQYLTLSKLIGVGCFLCFNINSMEEELFNKFFEVYFNFNELWAAKAELESKFTDSSRDYSEDKLFFKYFVDKIGYNFHEKFGINLSSIKENIFVFNSYFYIELVNFICFSGLENFFRKNHLRIFELGQKFCNNKLGYLLIMMISQILTSDRSGSRRTILSTTLGRSLGISFIPMLSQKLSSEQEPQEFSEEVEKVIENIVSIFVSSVVDTKNLKSGQLYCVLDCIISVFIYYISRANNFTLEATNHSIHRFVKIIHTQVVKKLKTKDNDLERLGSIGVYCIALLGAIRGSYSCILDDYNSIGSADSPIFDICRGVQFHISYFFVSNEEPEIFMRENTDIFDSWNHLMNTCKFRIPSYLFSKVRMKQSVHDQSHFKWSVPTFTKKKVTRAKVVKVDAQRKSRRLEASKTKVSDSYDAFEGKYDESDEGTFTSSSDNSDDENWVLNASSKSRAYKKSRSSNRLRAC